jgi:acetyltransferase-like isoleucine patch superfamily enzyme
MKLYFIKILKSLYLLQNRCQAIFWTWVAKNQSCRYIEPLTVNNRTNIGTNTYLGKNTNFNGMQISGCGRVDIGDNFHSGVECMIISQIHNYDNGERIPYDNTYKCKDVVIKDNVWIGSRVILLGGITIGEGAIIQAGSVVTSSIPDFSIAGGHPAKVFKIRNIQHYKRLKKEKKFN